MPLLNFRDVASTAGPGLRPGVLLRSAQPDSPTPDDAALLTGLRLIVDLRGAGEFTDGDRPVRAAPDARVIHRPLPGTTADLLALAATRDPGAGAGTSTGTGLGAYYVRVLDQHADWLAEVIAEIADRLPALVHCAAGKDRTGLVVALVLDLVGVDHDAIVRDYTATADHLPQIIDMLARRAPSAEAEERVRAAADAGLLDAPEGAIRTALEALAARGGSEQLLAPHGLSAAHIQRLRAALTG